MPTHKKPESERFKGPVKYAEYLVARALITVLQRVPIGLAYRLGRAVGWLAWLALPGRRRIVRKNLKIVNAWMDVRGTDGRGMRTDGGGMGTGGGGMMAEDGESEQNRNDPHHSSFTSHPASLALPLEAQVKEVFQRTGANLFAGFTFNRMSPEQAARHIKIEGIEHLKDALAEGKGAIILLAQMGPWEALAQLPGLARNYGIEAPFGAMYRPLNNTYLDDWYRQQREGQGTRLLSRRDGFHKPVDFLKSGGMLGILSDQKMREGPVAPYFGRDVPSTPLPGLFYRRSGAPLLAVSIATRSALCWEIQIAPVSTIDVVDTKNREAMAAVCNQAVANSLAQSPLDGFWLHKRF